MTDQDGHHLGRNEKVVFLQGYRHETIERQIITDSPRIAHRIGRTRQGTANT